MEEIWKDIKDYEGLYQISNLGSIKSLKRNKFLIPYNTGYGYAHVKLTKNNISKNFAVHRLVAEAFIENPKSLPCVNHKDYNRKNNKVDNLEWCSIEYNLKYSSNRNKAGTKDYHRRDIYQYDKEGNCIKKWDLLMDINRELGYNERQISDCCNNKVKTCKGYVWSYTPLTKKEVLDKQLRHQKPVIQYTLDGIFIREFNSGKEASKYTKVAAQNISRACKNEIKQAGGYIWKFK